jgi:DDE superfamily endonuclease
MPRTSERGMYIRELEQLIAARADFLEYRRSLNIVDDNEDKLDQFILFHLLVVKSKRYLNERPVYRTSLTQFQEDLNKDMVRPNNIPREITTYNKINDNYQPPWLTELEFQQKYWLTRHSFDVLFGLIKDHPVFKRNENIGRGQMQPEHQLMMLLKFLGTTGTGGSNPDLRNVFKIGNGTCCLYRERAMVAIRSLRDQVIKWPDEEERQQISDRIRQKHVFPNCVGFIDGTLLPLAFAPQTVDAPDYHGRKHQYSLSVLIINDDQRLVRYFLAGWPGSCHDNRIWKNTPVCQHPDRYFNEQQYILGDSAYENSNHMVSSYKCPRGMTLGWEEEIFNNALSSPRMSSEHTIGMLKARFQWLRLIRMQIKNDNKSLKRILMYIDTCNIIHNLLIKHKDRGDIIGEDPLDQWEELNTSVPKNARKDTGRQQLTLYIIETVIPK